MTIHEQNRGFKCELFDSICGNFYGTLKLFMKEKRLHMWCLPEKFGANVTKILWPKKTNKDGKVWNCIKWSVAFAQVNFSISLY